MTTSKTIELEDKYSPPFFKKIPVSIVRGQGIYVWDEEGNRYLDFTSGWGVTCLGHAHPLIAGTLANQGRLIMQNPNGGLTYSPVRADLLALMGSILPPPLTKIFFSNSGAESNDAAIKLARKATGRLDVIAMDQSFHGRTISTASATGQLKHRQKFNPLMPNYHFVPFNNLEALDAMLDKETAAVILEPIQGEGGVILPSEGYLKEVSRLCRASGALFIVDEIQTGFCRTGSMFAISDSGVEPDFMTMAKGIAGGFPFGAFAMSDAVAARLEPGDHGGTYCGNPLGCAVAASVIRYLIEQDISSNVKKIGALAINHLGKWHSKHPEIIKAVRGKGLLMAIEFRDEKTAGFVADKCLEKRLFVRQTQGNMIRIFPALNIKKEEMEEGLQILEEAIGEAG